jgi:hypothetical protein
LDEINAYYNVHSLSCSEAFKTKDESQSAGEAVDSVAELRINGDLMSCQVMSSGQKAVDIVFDGTQTWEVNHQNQTYYHYSGGSFHPRDYLPVTAAGGTLKIGQNLPLLPLFLSYQPSPSLKSIELVKEGTEVYRKVEFGEKSKKGNSLTLTEWFFPDRWILKKATFRTSIGYSADFIASNFNFSDKTPASEFKINPETLKGYKEIPPP